MARPGSQFFTLYQIPDHPFARTPLDDLIVAHLNVCDLMEPYDSGTPLPPPPPPMQPEERPVGWKTLEELYDGAKNEQIYTKSMSVIPVTIAHLMRGPDGKPILPPLPPPSEEPVVCHQALWKPKIVTAQEVTALWKSKYDFSTLVDKEEEKPTEKTN